MLTTSLAKKQAMELAMPDKTPNEEKKPDNTKIPEERMMTILIGKADDDVIEAGGDMRITVSIYFYNSFLCGTCFTSTKALAFQRSKPMPI